ncbi:MAG TPA: hypothetical protein PLB55_00195 [Prosthecobacter sp.]|jgi:hypothetical protein|nr:hypothetical protein [Prosthecobacter sp.]
MKIADMDYLLAYDDPPDCDAGANFDPIKEYAVVRSLGPELSSISGHDLKLDMCIEDASFFADWYACENLPRPHPNYASGVIHTIISIRFSAFGRMFAIWCGSDLFPISEDRRQRLIEYLIERDLVYAPDSLLGLPYHHPEWFQDWRTRYFDYL